MIFSSIIRSNPEICVIYTCSGSFLCYILYFIHNFGINTIRIIALEGEALNETPPQQLLYKIIPESAKNIVRCLVKLH